jgi:hypothetical protein
LLVYKTTVYEIENQALLPASWPLLPNLAAISRETTIFHLARLLHWRCDPDHKKSAFRCDGHHKKALFMDLPTDIGATGGRTSSVPRHVSIMIFASVREREPFEAGHSSRNLPLKLSVTLFADACRLDQRGADPLRDEPGPPGHELRAGISTPACISAWQNVIAPTIEDFHHSRKQRGSDHAVAFICEMDNQRRNSGAASPHLR